MKEAIFAMASASMPAGALLHIYAEDGQPQMHSDDELNAICDRLVDAVEREFRDANGGDQEKLLCSGCTTSLMFNILVTIAARHTSRREGIAMIRGVCELAVERFARPDPLAALLAALQGGGAVEIGR